MRRILIIAASIVVLAGVGIAAYVYFFPSTPSLTVAPVALPTESNPAPTTPITPLPTPTATTTGITPAVRLSSSLAKISDGPIVPGEAVIDSAGTASTSADTVVLFIERRSGNVFSYRAGDGTITRTNNKTLPGIQKAWWLPSGQVAFVQYLSSDFSTVETYALPAYSAESGFFLPQGLSDLAVASTSILELASGVSGSVATLAHPDGTHATTLFSSPLSALRVSTFGKDQYIAFPKPAQSLEGDAFVADASGRLSRIAGPLDGLVALGSPSGKKALLSYSAGGVLRTALLDAATRVLTILPITTLADKCVWTADGSVFYCAVPRSFPTAWAYPDDWYQGAARFSDALWKIDVASRTATRLIDSTNVAGGFDALALAVDQNKSLLVFVNKNDGSLWALRL